MLAGALMALLLASGEGRMMGTGDGWAMLPQVPERQLKTLYWELFDTSETWVSLIPGGPDGGPPRVRLVFHAYRRGKDVSGPAERLELQVVGLPLTVIPGYSFRLKAGEKDVDLAGACETPKRPGPVCAYLYPGEGWPPYSMVADVDQQLLRDVATAKAVTGETLGFPIVLTPEDQQAVLEFSRAADGVER